MNSEYKWREPTTSRLNGPKAKVSCENEENVSSINSFARKHQRNLSLPINSVFEPAMPKVDILTTMSDSRGNGISFSSPVHKNYQESNECDNDSSSNSDTGSTGTYIIERNDTSHNDDKSEQSPENENNIDDFKKSNSMVKKLRSSWVNEWHSKLNQNKSSLLSALPTPKSDFKPNSPTLNKHSRKSNIPLPNASSIKDLSENNSAKSTSSDDDTRLLLKDAENCVSMMEAKVEKTNHTTIRSNLTFNLRRDRFTKPLQNTNKKNVDTKTVSDKSNLHKPANHNLSSSLSRVDCGRYSLRTSRVPQPNSSPLLSARKNLSSKKKWNSSILCNKVQTPNKETELENWKRRKNYDPMKAAAQGKKKDTQKQPFSKEKSVDNSGNPVLRSASFHGRDVFSQEEDSDGWEQKSLHFYQPVDDWHKLPQPPATSRDHSPPPSKNDILSSSANSSLIMLPTLTSAHNGSPTSIHKSLSAFNSSTSSSLDVSSMPDALFDNKDTLDMVQLSYKAKKRGIELMKRIRNELPEYDDIELSREIGRIDIMDDKYHVSMKSWGMSVSASNINCVDGIFRILENVLFKDSGCGEDNSDN